MNWIQGKISIIKKSMACVRHVACVSVRDKYHFDKLVCLAARFAYTCVSFLCVRHGTNYNAKEGRAIVLIINRIDT